MTFSKQMLTGALVAAALLGWAGTALAEGVPYIVESRSGGLHNASYSETGAWANSTAKSTATGCTAGIGCRYTTVYDGAGAWYSGRVATFSFTALETGPHNIYATWGTSSGGYSKVDHIVQHDDTGGALTTTTVVLSHRQAEGLNNKWNLLGRFNLTRGKTYTVQETVSDKTGIPATSSRIQSDAVYWAFDGCSCTQVPAVSAKLPLMPGDTIVRVTGIDPAATKVSVYINGATTPAGTFTFSGAAPAEQDVTVPALQAGQRINVTQTKLADCGSPPVATLTESCLELTGPIVGACEQIPAVTALPVLLNGDTTVKVAGVDPAAKSVKVYANGTTLLGTLNAPFTVSAPDNRVVVTVSPALTTGQVISATQALASVGGSGAACESCVPTTGPEVGNTNQILAVTVVGMVDQERTVVRVSGVHKDATLVKIYVNDVSVSQIATPGNGNTPSTVKVTVPALQMGQIVKATQTIRIEGLLPDKGRRVMAKNVIEDFEDELQKTDLSPLQDGGGRGRVWYQVSDTAWGLLDWATMLGSKCMDVRDSGWSNGAYAIFEQTLPATDDYYISADMLVNETGNRDPDLYMTYQFGLMVGSAAVHRTGNLANITDPVGNYTGPLTAAQDGFVDQTTPSYPVLSGQFHGSEGDNVLIAFSTSTNGYSVSQTFTGDYPGMMVDNIKLNVGQRPCVPEDVPTVVIKKGPLEDGGHQVIVSGVNTAATLVTVYAFVKPSTWTKLGSANPGGATEITVTLDADKKLIEGMTIVATQTMVPPVAGCAAIEGAKPFSGPVVGLGKNTPIMLSLGVREVTGTGPIGGDGGTTGTIEWIGATGTVSGAPVTGPEHTLTPGPNWQTITFNPAKSGGTDPVLAYTGNGVLDGNWATLEHLALTIAAPMYSTGRYVLYVDNVMNGTTTIADFEGVPANTTALFRTPNVSGSTSANLLNPPAVATVDSSKGDASVQSLRLEFQFVDKQPYRWVRITTDGTGITPAMPYLNPMVDLTKPITLRVLFFACHSPFGDADDDGDVDMADFGVFQSCFTASNVESTAPGCACFSVPNWSGAAFVPADSDVDIDDYAEFLKCVTGPGVPYAKAQHPDCEQW